MDLRKLVAAAAFAVAVVPLAAAHPGPEPHPTVEELEAVAAEIRSVIGEVEQRLSEQIDGLEVPVDVLDEQAVAEIAQRAVDEAVGELVQSSNELNDRVEAAVALGAMLMATLAVVAGFLGFRVRALGKRLPRLLQPAGETQEVGPEPTDRTNPKDEVGEERSADRRFVTHTLKESAGPGMHHTIKELHNLGDSWSPKTVEEAIADIDGGIQYWTRSPDGNEAEIEVMQGPTGRYLRTKPDEQGGNNLGELPDP